MDEPTLMMRSLLSHGAQVDAPGDEGWTPLMQAAQTGQIPALRLLLERGANKDATNINGETALNENRFISNKIAVRNPYTNIVFFKSEMYSMSHFCCYPFRCELLKK